MPTLRMRGSRIHHLIIGSSLLYEGAGRRVLHGVFVVLNLPFGAFEMLTAD